eukprot:TRINITY_DN3913_c6_g1_i2.p1 TRINITY_DN3913_c6_g1~~TRINITY_DN3913_c6_g1_i2.p1  ORF type:complete len:499 (+),score=79.59 TRINITY_DN3913_c6_g1_i2:50-1546(+)
MVERVTNATRGELESNSTNYSESSSKKFVNAVATLKDEVSTLIEPSKKASPLKPIHVASIVFNLLQTTMGVGILSLAATFEFAGLFGGTIMFICAAALAHLSMSLLLDGLTITGAESYESLGFHCFGKPGRIWVQVMLIGCSMLALTCFLVPLKAFIHDTLDQIGVKHASPDICLSGALAVVIFPLSLLRKIDKLWFTSLLGVTFVLYFVVVSIAYMGVEYNSKLESRTCHELDVGKNHPKDAVKYFGSKAGDFMQAISIIACSFCCQMTVFPIYREVRVADPESVATSKIRKASAISMLVACVTYTAAASSGYLIWRDLCPDPSSILACYDPGKPYITLVYLGMTCVMMFAFPLVLFSVRYCAATVIYGEDEASDLSTPKHVLLTLAITAPVATVAFVSTKLTSVIAIGGAFTAPCLCYVIPGALNIKAKSMYRSTQQDSEDDLSDFEGGVEDGVGLLLEKRRSIVGGPAYGGWVMFLFGCVAQVLCLLGAYFGVFT